MPFEVTKVGAEGPGRFEVTAVGSGKVPRAEQPEEGWGSYLGRNIAQLATTTPYSLLRSGLGMGNIVNAALQDLPMPEGARKFLLESQQSNLPTIAKAREEAAGYLPKFATEMRPGDEWFQALAPQAIIAGATGGLSSLPAAAESALSALGIMGGAELGGEALQSVFPESKLAPEIGSLAGGLAGGLAGRLVPGTGRSIMPSKALKPEKVLREAKPEQKALYGAAEQLAEGAAAKPTDLLKKADRIEKNIGYGLDEADAKSLTKLIDDIKGRTQSGQVSPAGTLSLEEAKAFRRNINERFKDKLSPTMRHNLGEINTELKKFILKEGSQEHNTLWLKGEKLTQNIGDLERQIAKAKNRPEWLKSIMGLSKLGISPTLGYLAKFAGASSKLIGGAAGLSQLAYKIFNEANYLRNISKKFPTSYNKYLDTVWQATKSDSPKIIARLNSIADEMNKVMPFEEETNQ